MRLTPQQEKAEQIIAIRHPGKRLHTTPRPPMGELSARVDVYDTDPDQWEIRYRVRVDGTFWAEAGHLEAV